MRLLFYLENSILYNGKGRSSFHPPLLPLWFYISSVEFIQPGFLLPQQTRLQRVPRRQREARGWKG